MMFQRSMHFIAATLFAVMASTTHVVADKPSTLNIDWATYNPLSVVLKANGYLEQALADSGIRVRWVQSAGSNKALEFLNAEALDFGSTAGSAALLASVNGNPIKIVSVYSRPEWTALVTRKDTAIHSPADLRGKRIAVTRGTDAYVFLIRALEESGLTEKDVKPVLLQHADGKLALLRGDVDAWAGLDPMMAAAELEAGAELFHRNLEANTWGTLCVRTEFAKKHPDLVAKVLQAYEQARVFAVEHPDQLTALLAKSMRLPPEIVQRQLQRTDLDRFALGASQRATISAAGLALQRSGIIKPDVNVDAAVDALIDPSFH
ncbi:aliphatic sulfonate ABC transporter substrate-binding protein [Hyphomicrobium sulfonivorans]|uniref:aliphatic sulfonate ABC transporter substrate-binding protein n=1 Tax=Hyphomicrobium sulfonivorans TaxID=121290 RepID=UPI0030B80D75|nr:aliphatic sulfonates ABC transporter substrate-binding protein [Hyphomicrobium sulfonivorans]